VRKSIKIRKNKQLGVAAAGSKATAAPARAGTEPKAGLPYEINFVKIKIQGMVLPGKVHAE